MEVSRSVIFDIESNRRDTVGTGVLKRHILAIVNLRDVATVQWELDEKKKMYRLSAREQRELLDMVWD